MRPGDRILSYIVDRELGEGGMGTVYLGRHTALDQLVAIKSLSPMLSRDEALRARFLQEANIQAKLRHPGIVQVLTADMESEQPSLVMEYIDGKSLSEVLEFRGALPIEDALKIMEQVLSAVGYAHRQGVIHRDLKPSNVMVMGNGEAKVTDFGIAKVLGSSKLTRTGTAMGSAHYMSPEQIRRPETVDARSDIYSLGCVFYEVLTGRPPFGEKDASGTESDYEVKTAHVTEPAPALETVKRGIPSWLAKLVMSMLEKEAENRPSSCEVIVEKLIAGDNLEGVQKEKTSGESSGARIEQEYREGQKNSPQEEATAEEKKLEGLGGWLIAVGIGIIISPFRIITPFFSGYPEIFSNGSWAALTMPGTEAYNPPLALIICGEMVISGGLFLASTFTAFLFFSKKKIFPKWYIGTSIFSLAFVVVDALIVKSVMPNVPLFNDEMTKEFWLSLITALVWVPYMLVSKRVKITFVR